MVHVSRTRFIVEPPSLAVINASGVVPVASTGFVFIDNTDGETLSELNLNHDGTQHGPVVKRRIVGIAGALTDPEGIARINRDGGAIDLIVASSLALWGTRLVGSCQCPRRPGPDPLHTRR